MEWVEVKGFVRKRVLVTDDVRSFICVFEKYYKLRGGKLSASGVLAPVLAPWFSDDEWASSGSLLPAGYVSCGRIVSIVALPRGSPRESGLKLLASV